MKKKFKDLEEGTVFTSVRHAGKVFIKEGDFYAKPIPARKYLEEFRGNDRVWVLDPNKPAIRVPRL